MTMNRKKIDSATIISAVIVLALYAAVFIAEVDWIVVLGTALTAALLSVLTSVAGLPEVEESEGKHA